MNCIDCSYSLLKDGHSKCTYEEGECIKMSVFEKENAELKEDLRNKKLGIQNRNGRIKELEEKISVLLSCKNCPENKGGLICQKEYEDKCLAQKIQQIKELQQENAELEKENAELKEKYKWLGSSTKCWFRNAPCRSCDEHDERLRLLGLCYIGQLTRAKEIIKKLVNGIRVLDDPKVELTDCDGFLAEAEQFLKEKNK